MTMERSQCRGGVNRKLPENLVVASVIIVEVGNFVFEIKCRL